MSSSKSSCEYSDPMPDDILVTIMISTELFFTYKMNKYSTISDLRDIIKKDASFPKEPNSNLILIYSGQILEDNSAFSLITQYDKISIHAMYEQEIPNISTDYETNHIDPELGIDPGEDDILLGNNRRNGGIGITQDPRAIMEQILMGVPFLQHLIQQNGVNPNNDEENPLLNQMETIENNQLASVAMNILGALIGYWFGSHHPHFSIFLLFMLAGALRTSLLIGIVVGIATYYIRSSINL